MLSDHCSLTLAAMCAGKARFETEERAAARCRRRQRTYACKLCDTWHNGDAASFDQKLGRDQERIIEGLRRFGYPLQMLIAGFSGMSRQAWLDERNGAQQR